jgi:hypothetical protein
MEGDVSAMVFLQVRNPKVVSAVPAKCGPTRSRLFAWRARTSRMNSLTIYCSTTSFDTLLIFRLYYSTAVDPGGYVGTVLPPHHHRSSNRLLFYMGIATM